MRTMTATEVARGFRRVLDSLEQGGEEIVVMRNSQPVARLVPGAPRMTAVEAMGDLYRVLDDAEGAAWSDDAIKMDRLLVAEARDPWA
jgi:antitoxin (DNA-binding transcriptional repressor) of toxin-antitoxin stability system